MLLADSLVTDHSSSNLLDALNVVVQLEAIRRKQIEEIEARSKPRIIVRDYINNRVIKKY